MSHEIYKDKIKLVLDNNVIEEYNKYYFRQHPKAKKKPIEKPIHPSINQWCILPRIQMNALKQKWKDFVEYWIKKEGLTNRQLDDFSVVMTVFFDNKIRKDADNYSPKFIMDGWTESGFIVDDDWKHLKSLTIIPDYDKENPRTEFEILLNTESLNN